MKRPLRSALLLASLAVLLYLSTLGSGFRSDDVRLIVENPRIKSLSRLGETLTQPFFAFPDHPYLHYWRPLTLLSFWIDYRCWGLNPAGYHLTNLLLNAAVSALLFLLLLQASGRAGFSFLAALLFTLHPAHVETVAWISGRTDLLCTLFLLLGALLLNRGLARRAFWPVPAALISYLLALAAKEFALLAPPLLFGWLLMRREPVARALGLTGPFAAAALGFGLLHGRFADTPALLGSFSPADFLLVVKSLGVYARILMLPVFPAPVLSMAAFDADGWLHPSLTLLFLLLLLWVWRRRRDFPVTAAALPLLLFLLPVLDPALVPSYPKIALRFAYLPSLWAALFFGELFCFLGRLRFSKNRAPGWRALPVAVPGLALLAIAWTALGWGYRGFFHSEKAELERLVRVQPGDGGPFFSLAVIQAREGRYGEALDLVERGMRKPSRWIDLRQLGSLLKANLLLTLNRREEGRQAIESVLRSAGEPQHRFYGRLLLAVYYQKGGDFPAALKQLEVAESYGQTAELLFRKAVVLARLKRFADALRALDRARELDPDLPRTAELRAVLAREQRLLGR